MGKRVKLKFTLTFLRVIRKANLCTDEREMSFLVTSKRPQSILKDDLGLYNLDYDKHSLNRAIQNGHCRSIPESMCYAICLYIRIDVVKIKTQVGFLKLLCTDDVKGEHRIDIKEVCPSISIVQSTVSAHCF